MKALALGLIFIPATLLAGNAALFREAGEALRSGIPQVGIVKLQSYLDGELTNPERLEARLQLARAFIASGKTTEARDILQSLDASEQTRWLLAQSFLTDGNWRAALDAIPTLPDPSSTLYAATRFARAEAHRGLGENKFAEADYLAIEADPNYGKDARLRMADLAMQQGTPLKSSSTPTAIEAVIQAENVLAKKDYTKAEEKFRALQQNPAGQNARAFGTMQLGLAEALSGLGKNDEAEDALESFIEKWPMHEMLPEAFAALEEIYGKEKNPSANQLRRWSKDSSQAPRQALAIYYQSLFDLHDKGSEAALSTLSSWLQKFPKHPLRASVLLRFGEESLAVQQRSAAVQHLEEGLALKSSPAIQAQLHVALARALFASSDYAKAAAQFQEGANLLTSAADSLLYNQALCWLRAGDFEKFLAAYQTFSQLFPESPLRRDLLIEEGFLQARSRQFEAAMKTLSLFIRDFPEHQRIPDAHLALAEMALGNPGSDGTIASKELTLATQASPSPEVAERAAFLEVKGISDRDDPDGSKRLDLCEKFLATHSGSSFEADVRFKMGELYFGNKDYTSAGTQFEVIASKFPDSPLLEQARFLGGQSAIRTMNPSAVDGAISLFEQVVRMKGPLQSYARYEQALVKKNAGALDEALVLCDDLLAQNPPADLLCAGLAARGEILYLLGGDQIASAVSTFSKLAGLPEVSRYWRNLALFKKGKALGLLGKREEMLTAYYDVLAAPETAGDTPETFWFYRAGFEAAELLETDEQWKAAIAIYQKLAAAKGPRAAEASQRIERLRLEHFIWE